MGRSKGWLVYDSSVIRWINILYLASLVIPLLGCGLLDSQEARQTALKEGLVAAEARGRVASLSALDLNQPEVLVNLMNRSIGPQMGDLGPQIFVLQARFELTAEGESQVKIEDSIRLKIDEEGRFFLEHGTTSSALGERPRIDGRRCWWVDGQYFVGRLHGPATQVPTNGDEQNICLQSSLDPLRGFLALIGHNVTPNAVGHDRLRDRVRHTVRLSQETAEDSADADIEFSEPVPKTYPADPKETRSAAIWGPRVLLTRSHLEVVELEGEISLDESTGIPLGADLKGRLSLEKGEKDALLDFAITLEVEENSESISPPETDRRFTPRQRIFADHAHLLGQKTLPGKGKKRAILPSPGDAPKLALGPDGRLVAVPQGQNAGAKDDGSALPQPGDAPKLVLGPNGLVQPAAETNDAGAPAPPNVLDEDAPDPVGSRAPEPTSPVRNDAESPAPSKRPPMGPPVPVKRPPMGPPVPTAPTPVSPSAPPADDEDLPL